MRPKVFIDGHTGTTGLRIHQWMTGREDVELLTLPPELRRNPEERQARLLQSDAAILCLPDDAAIEAAEWVKNAPTRLIDASTAHRRRPRLGIRLARTDAGTAECHRQRQVCRQPRLLSYRFHPP